MGTKISDLTALTASAEADVFPVVDDSAATTKKITQTNLRTSLLTGALATVADGSALTASRAMATDSSGQVAVSAVTSTELGYVSGVTSAIQTQFNAIPKSPASNLVGNGNFLLFDLGAAPSVADNDYFCPGWRILAVTSPTAGQQSSSPPDGSRYWVRITEAAPGAVHYVGMFYVLRANDSIPLRNKTASLSFYAKASRSGAGSVNTIRAGVLAWDSTADATTGDPVSVWGATPTMAANWTFENTPANLGTSASWTAYSIEAISLDTASFNNLAVFIWATGDTQAASALQLDVTQVQLEVGATATTFVNRLEREERDFVARNDYTFTAAPGVGDDIIDGFALGSVIIDVTNNEAYICMDCTAGAAIWGNTTT